MRLVTACIVSATLITVSLVAQQRRDLIQLVGHTFAATVIGVSDGDTVRVRISTIDRAIPVRLEGIDCPENGEVFGGQARNATRVMMFDKKVQIKAIDVDRSDRLVGENHSRGTGLESQARRIRSRVLLLKILI